MGLLIECEWCEGTGEIIDEETGKVSVCSNCNGKPRHELHNWSWHWI